MSNVSLARFILAAPAAAAILARLADRSPLVARILRRLASALSAALA